MNDDELRQLALDLAADCTDWLRERLTARGLSQLDTQRVISLLLSVGHEFELFVERQKVQSGRLQNLSYHCYACGRTCGTHSAGSICQHCEQVFHYKCLEAHLWSIWRQQQRDNHK